MNAEGEVQLINPIAFFKGNIYPLNKKKEGKSSS